MLVVVAWSVAAEGLRFKGETKGLWMPRESTRRLFGAGDGEGMVFKDHIGSCLLRCREVDEFGKSWRGRWRFGRICHPAA